jgi:hypothetical protein
MGLEYKVQSEAVENRSGPKNKVPLSKQKESQAWQNEQCVGKSIWSALRNYEASKYLGSHLCQSSCYGFGCRQLQLLIVEDATGEP